MEANSTVSTYHTIRKATSRVLTHIAEFVGLEKQRILDSRGCSGCNSARGQVAALQSETDRYEMEPRRTPTYTLEREPRIIIGKRTGQRIHVHGKWARETDEKILAALDRHEIFTALDRSGVKPDAETSIRGYHAKLWDASSDRPMVILRSPEFKHVTLGPHRLPETDDGLDLDTEMGCVLQIIHTRFRAVVAEARRRSTQKSNS